MINPCDTAELLDRLGYYVDDSTGEVFVHLEPCAPPTFDKFLFMLAVMGQLITKRNADFELPTKLAMLQQYGRILRGIPL